MDDEVQKLTDAQTGRWRVLTDDRLYIVDLDKRTVTSEPRPDTSDGPTEGAMPLRNLHICWVGDTGFWTINTTGSSPSVEYYWLVTAVIRHIAQLHEK
jgi:hypothetical protein